MPSQDLKSLHNAYKETSLFGRYITLKHLVPLIENLPSQFEVKVIGASVLKSPIHTIAIGKGEKRILLWSQMHGNESTTTKAIFDLLKVLISENEMANNIINHCKLLIIPLLNPDGALAYTRVNANGIDLNRDAQNLSQPESRALRSAFDAFKPHFCFNLHGQRTIFSAGEAAHSATVSFLTPAAEMTRSVTSSRKVSMAVISKMNEMLQEEIPDQVGLYDDHYNSNCVGDAFQSLEVPTILFEAGHYKEDYEREKTRELIFYALITSLNYIVDNEIMGNNYESYFKIPENGKCFYDIIIRDVMLKDKNVDIGIQYTEELSENVIKFLPKVVEIADLQKKYGHREIIGNKRAIYNENVTVEVVPDTLLLKFRLNDELFSTELRKR